MGYTTEFFGSVEIKPPLNEPEIAYLCALASFDESPDHDPLSADQPDSWCQWVPSEDGTALEWDGNEKFYDAELWMAYLIEHFLKPSAHAAASGDPRFEQFGFDHILGGEIEAQGEEYDDHWLLRVRDNQVTVLDGQIQYVNPRPVAPSK